MRQHEGFSAHGHREAQTGDFVVVVGVFVAVRAGFVGRGVTADVAAP
jgi:hypothetical protein